MYKIYQTNWYNPPGYIPKLLRVMRLTVIFLIAAIMQVSASSYGQKISLNYKNVDIVKLNQEIFRQSGYYFIHEKTSEKEFKPVSIAVQNATIQEVLELCFAGQPLVYEIKKNKSILVKAKEKSIVDRITSLFALIDVIGKVVDETGSPLPGATVLVKGSSKTAKTNTEGVFTLTRVEENAILVVSFIGYDQQEVKATENVGTIKMVLGAGKLEEVQINAGYYTVTDRERTGNISKVTAETIGKQPVNNPLMALVGNITGLQITQQTGIPGGAFTVRIRGRNSINSGNDPLYIIDDVIYPSTRISGGNTSNILGTAGVSPLSLINPGDIESIEVLKDADATAIYGSRGANGVILITTKMGKSGNNRIDASVAQGYSQVGNRIALLNSEQYISMRREAFKNDGLSPTATDYDVNGTWDANNYTDWQKELIGGNSPAMNASLGISGGSEKSNYRLSGNFYKEGSVFPGNFGFHRASMISNFNIGSSLDRFSASFIANYSHTQSDQLITDLTQYMLLPPNSPSSYDQYDKLTWSNNTVQVNPFALLLQTSDASTDNFVGNISLNYRIVKGLILKTSIGYTTIKRDELQKTPLASYSPAFGFTSANRVSLFGANYNNSLIVEPMITYQSSIGSGKAEVLVGMSAQTNDYQIRTIQGAGFSSDDLMDVIGSAALLTTNQNIFSQYRYTAVYARINYNYESKYILNLTARRDGSSRFGSDRQFANFGAIGAAWVFSEENFIGQNFGFLNFGKLRASYGVTGNDQIADYGYLQLWNNTGTYQGVSALSPGTSAANADFGWETNRKLEAALQLGFAKDKVGLEISIYKNVSSNQLLFQTLPLSTGLGGVNANLPGKIQNTGWEVGLDVKLLKRKNLDWHVNFNLTVPRNKLLTYPGLETSSNAAIYQVGSPLSILKAYNITVNSQTGLYVAEDKNNNGIIDDGDRYLIEFVGQRYYGGLKNSLKYKRFNLDFSFFYVNQKGRNDRILASRTAGGWLASIQTVNQLSDVLSRWQQPGDVSLYQKFTTISANNSLNTSVKNYGNLSVADASYFRLRNVSLSYSLPRRFLSVLKISDAALSIQGQNMFTLTKYAGLDPETQNLNLPPLRTVVMGLNVTF